MIRSAARAGLVLVGGLAALAAAGLAGLSWWNRSQPRTFRSV